MMNSYRGALYFGIMALMLILVGVFQSWSLALAILNLCLISAIMSLGVNMQWGYAGLLNVGVMGFAALGGITAVLISIQPVPDAIAQGGKGIVLAFAVLSLFVIFIVAAYRFVPKFYRIWAIIALVAVGIFVFRQIFDPAVLKIEAVNPAGTGNLGGLHLPIVLSWPIAGLVAAAAAWCVGKISLGLRSDYLAIATLGISEIIISVIKNEDWLTRGVKNVSGLPRPVPYEVDLQKSADFLAWADWLGADVQELSSIVVKLSYAGLFLITLAILMWLSERALNAPWGRMMRAIRDNEDAAEAMGKDVTGRHLAIFILGSAVVGIAGAMLTTLDGQFTPTSYQPLRFTFLIWVMVIVGGSGNNWGAVLGGFVIWFFWIEAEPLGLWFIELLTIGMDQDSDLRAHLLNSAAHMRLMTMGVVLLLVLRFAPKGLLPEK